MNMHKLCMVLFAFTVLTGCTQTSWMKKDLETLKPDIDTVSIIVPHVEYSEKSGEAKTIKTGHSVFVSMKVADVLKEIIDEGHFISKYAVIKSDSAVIDEWLPRSFSNSIRQYKFICDSLVKSQNEKRTFPVNSDLQLLIDKVSTRYLIFVSGTAFGTSEETKRYDFIQAQTFKLLYDRPFIYDYQWVGLQLKIFFFDTKSKEIVWYNSNDSRDTKYDPIKGEEIKALCRKLLQVN